MGSKRGEVPHITNVSLRNFRGFKSVKTIPMAPLTFLVGPNSSGKSSIFDALLLLAQNGFGFVVAHHEASAPKWTGELVDLGSFADTVHRHQTNLSIEIGVDWDGAFPFPFKRAGSKGDPLSLSLHYVIRAPKKYDNGYLSSIDLVIDESQQVTFRWRPRRARTVDVNIDGSEVTFTRDSDEHVGEFYQRTLKDLRALARRHAKSARQRRAPSKILHYLKAQDFGRFLTETERVSSGRAGPQRSYPVRAEEGDTQRFWFHGPRVYDEINPKMLLAMMGDSPEVDPGLRKRREKDLVAFLRELNIANRISHKGLSAYHSAIHVRDNVTKVDCNLSDVGYGASQVLPVVRGCLSGSSGPLFVEQPEIHLHPKAQGIVADHLCKASKQRQVVVETHSEHLINRARIQVASGDLDPAQVVINYVSRDNRGSHVSTIRLDSNGEFDRPWPDGFFDERYEDTMTLLSLREPAEGSQ